MGRRLGRDVKAREKAGAKAKKLSSNNRQRVVSTAKSGWIEDSFRKTHPLIGALRRHIVAANEQLNDERPYGFIHPSWASKADWCPRASWYEVQGYEPELEDISYRIANIFAEGHEIHEKYQRWFWNMGVLTGMWFCRGCDHRWWAQSPRSCESCGSDQYLVYDEVPIELPELLIQGRGDGIVTYDDKTSLLEIKTIGLRSIELDYPKLYRPYKDGTFTLNQLWASIKSPFPVHVRQAMLYFYVLNRTGHAIDDVIILYEFKANQDVKAFTVGYKDSVIASILRGAGEVVEAVERGVPVRRPSWAESPETKTCKSCRFREFCWD